MSRTYPTFLLISTLFLSAGAALAQTSSPEELAAQAATDFRAQRFEASLEGYQKALGVATEPADQAALRMNAGACLIELQRWDEARQEFLTAARLDATVAAKAKLSVAAVAVAQDQLDEASRLLTELAPIPDALREREQALRARLADKRNQGRRSALLVAMENAEVAIRAEKWSSAEAALRLAEADLEVATRSERLDVIHSLGVVQLELEQPQLAKETLMKGVASAPSDPELHLALGRAEEALEHDAEARAEYRRALELGLAEPAATTAKRRLEGLDPLEPSAWLAWLAVAGGYDSNPRQSGVLTETTLGRRSRGGTGYGRVAAELGGVQRVSDKVALSLRYTGDWLVMQKRTVRELGTMSHALLAGASWAPNQRFTLGLELGPSITYLGLSPMEPFASDLSAELRARYRMSRVRSLRMSFGVSQIAGADGWEFLSGTRLDAEASHGWFSHPVDLRLGLRGRYLAIGTRTTTVDATVIPACVGVCDGAEYQIPLSYYGVGPTASLRVALLPSLALRAYSGLELREYSSESYIVGVPQSRKTREDWRYSAALDLRWALDRGEHLFLVPSYAALVSASNIAQSPNDPSHAFDYDDRSFVQHLVELGVEVEL